MDEHHPSDNGTKDKNYPCAWKCLPMIIIEQAMCLNQNYFCNKQNNKLIKLGFHIAYGEEIK